MKDVDKDIKNTRIVIENGPGYWAKDEGNFYSKLYFSTNESASDIIKYFDIKNKDILTVIGSGDQAFCFCKYSPKGIDLFDKNKLAIYYFYLRLWTINYLDCLYPDFIFEKNGIRDLLINVKPESDEEIAAYEYWDKYSKIYDSRDTWNMILSGVFDTKILDNEDIHKIKEGISLFNHNVFNIDISHDIGIQSKYDIIYTSNISDFIDDINNMKIYRDNLYDLLKDDGFVICSNVTQFGESYMQQRVFDDKFSYHELPCEYVKLAGDTYSLGYYYTKRK